MSNAAAKDQFIAICAQTPQQAQALLPLARTIATAFSKGIIIFSSSPDAPQWAPTLGEPHVMLNSPWPDIVEALPIAFNVVLALAPYDLHASRQDFSHPRQLQRNFRNSRVAYIAVPLLPDLRTDATLPIDHLALTLDDHPESKQKILWASYMARFCHSNIHVYHLPYSDQAMAARCQNNIRYLHKIFSSLSLQYTLTPLPEGNQYRNPDLIALSVPLPHPCDLLLSLLPDLRSSDLFDLLSPPLAVTLMRKAAPRPILFLNQRDDLFIICD